MKEPIPTKGKSATAERAPAVKSARPNEITEIRVRARFYRRMKLQRVFPLVVEWQGVSNSALTAPVFIHPVIPGAHVIPPEQTLDPATPHCQATFHVTPLARGKLRNARLDIFYQGRLIQELPLSMRSVTQRLTWVLAALTVLVPAFLLLATVAYPLDGVEYRASAAAPEPQANAPAEVKEKPEQQPVEKKMPPADQDKKEPKNNPGASEDKESGSPNTASQDKNRGPSKPAAVEPAAGAQPRDAGPPLGTALKEGVRIRLGPGDVLERAITKHVPDISPNVQVPWRDEPYVLPFTITKSIASGLSTLYTYAVAMKDDQVSFWVGVVFLGLTVASGITHRPARGRKRSKPLVLGADGLQPPHA